MEPIILASGSHRRQDFFRLLSIPFSIMPALIDESLCAQKEPEKLTLELARQKVEWVEKELVKNLPRWIFGADTVIASGDQIFGKPDSRENACQMLKELSGKKHKVITSMALFNSKEMKIDCRSAHCSVVFAPMSEDEINWYIDTNEWQGVAGAYRIQGLAACFIDRIEGSPSTVAGLPLREFYDMLRDNGYPFGACKAAG